MLTPEQEELAKRHLARQMAAANLLAKMDGLPEPFTPETRGTEYRRKALEELLPKPKQSRNTPTEQPSSGTE